MCARKFFSAAAVAIGLLSAILPLGCSKGGSTSVDPKAETTHIAKAGEHVREYMAENKGKAPQNTSEIKDWAAKKNIPEDELVSTRDHEPYLVYEISRGPEKELILTEKTGVKGKKFMLKKPGPTPLGYEVDQEQIDSAIKASSSSRQPGAPR
jgi:hypothetical protein